MKARKHLRVSVFTTPLGWPALPGNWWAWLPSRGNVLFTLVVVAGLLWAGRAGALPLNEPAAPALFPSQLNYQGYVRDLNGTPLDGTYDMIFRLYDAPTAGNLLWEEDWTAANNNNQVTVTEGLFNVALGRLNPITAGVLNHDALYVGISIDGDPEASPREQLTMVPYSWSASTVSDGAITAAKIADGAVTSTKLNLTTGDLYLGQGGGGSASKLRWDSTNPAYHWLGYDPSIAPWWMIFAAHTNEGFLFRNDTDGTLVQIGGSNSSVGKGMSLNGNLNMTGVVQSSNNIPTAALQDGAITSRKLRPNTLSARADQPAGLGGSGTEFFGAGSVCVEVTSNVLLLATVNFYTTGGGGQLNFHVTRDGAQVGSTFHQDINTSKEVVTIVMLDQNVGPGCHSYSIWGDGALGQASEKNFVAIPFAR